MALSAFAEALDSYRPGFLTILAVFALVVVAAVTRAGLHKKNLAEALRGLAECEEEIEELKRDLAAADAALAKAAAAHADVRAAADAVRSERRERHAARDAPAAATEKRE
jgi:hypothetical protein